MSAVVFPPPPPPPQFVVQTIGFTEIVTVEELFDGFGSVRSVDSRTTAVFAMVVPAVPAFTVAAIVSVALELAARPPIVHVPVLELYVPCEVVAETKVKPDGSVSVATMSVDVVGPKA